MMLDGQGIVVRSFGLGVYSVTRVGGEALDAKGAAAWCEANGLEEAEVLPDPKGETNAVYVVCCFGQDPCRAELDQLREELEPARRALSSGSPAASRRLAALESALEA